MSRDADTLSLNHFKITKVEAVSDKHLACVVRNAYSKESITRSVFWVSASDFTLETEESHRKFETRRGGGAKDAEFRNLDWSVYAKFSSTQNGVRLRSAETLLWSISPLYKFGN